MHHFEHGIQVGKVGTTLHFLKTNKTCLCGVALSEIVITDRFYKKKRPSTLYLFNLVKNITNNIIVSEVLKTIKKKKTYIARLIHYILFT